MTTVGQDFPKSREARKEKLQEIKRQDNSISSIKVPGHGLQKVYRIPLEYLSYNPFNTRFLAQARTLETVLGRKLDDARAEDVREIEKFIWNEKADANGSTINSLIKEGQLQPGVVTINGVILSGNRRFRLLNEISRNPDKYASNRTSLHGLEYFEAAILDDELSDKDIVKYESFYQYGTEDKVEYDPIQKYIAANEQKSLGFSCQEIANNFLTLTKGKESKVQEYLNVFELMNEYLEYIGEPGIYTALNGREEAFLNLYETQKRLLRGNRTTSAADWAFNEYDLIDLKNRYFDYIRTNIKTFAFRDFQKIFQDGQRWREFNNQVRTTVENGGIESFEEYRSKNAALDESNIAKKRQRDYIDRCGDILNEIYGKEKAKNEGIKEIEENNPLRIVSAIEKKLQKLEERLPDEVPDEVKERIRELYRHISHIKQRVD